MSDKYLMTAAKNPPWGRVERHSLPYQTKAASKTEAFLCRSQCSVARNLKFRPLGEGPCSHQQLPMRRHIHTWFSFWGKGPLPFSETDIGGTTHSLLRLRKIRLDGKIFNAFLSCRVRRPLNPDMPTSGTHPTSSRLQELRVRRDLDGSISKENLE